MRIGVLGCCSHLIPRGASRVVRTGGYQRAGRTQRLLTGPGVRDRSLGVQLGLTGRVATAGVGSAVAEAVEPGLPIVRMTAEPSADMCIDAVPAAARFDRE